MRAINWRVGIRRLFLVALVPYVALVLLITSRESEPAPVLLIFGVVALAAYGLLEGLIWALSGFAVSRAESADSTTMEVAGQLRTLHVFDIVHAQRFHLVGGDGKLWGYLAVNEDGPELTLADGEHVRLRVGLRGGNPHIVLTSDQVDQVRLYATDSGTAGVTISDSRGELRAGIGVLIDGSPYALTRTEDDIAESKAENKPRE